MCPCHSSSTAHARRENKAAREITQAHETLWLNIVLSEKLMIHKSAVVYRESKPMLSSQTITLHTYTSQSESHKHVMRFYHPEGIEQCHLVKTVNAI